MKTPQMHNAEMGSVRLRYRIVSEPRGPAYEALVHYCVAAGSSCTLADLFSSSRAGRQARADFLGQALPCLETTIAAERWPLGEPETGDPKSPTPLWRFALTERLTPVLLSGPRRLYGWKAPRFPEDLAVYRKDGSVLLGAVAHEHIGWLNLSSEEAADVRLGLLELQPAHR